MNILAHFPKPSPEAEELYNSDLVPPWIKNEIKVAAHLFQRAMLGLDISLGINTEAELIRNQNGFWGTDLSEQVRGCLQAGLGDGRKIGRWRLCDDGTYALNT